MTVLAIGQQVVSNEKIQPQLYSVTVALSFLSFMVFAGAGLYVWGRFAYYAELAQILSDEIVKDAKLDEIRITGESKVKALLVRLKNEGKDEKKLNFLNYYHLVVGQKQDNSRTRRYIMDNFRLFYILLILILALIAYLPVLIK